ncbi:MAG: MFS transporter [Clostridia bacterium]|nr:MFS transporter [Clostridia bacterium]
MKNPIGFLFSKEKNDEGISNREILRYSIGAVGSSISSGFVSGRVTYFYENHVVPGDHAHYVGKIMTGSIIWDAINDVLVGGFIDRRNHKPYQKMRPFLLYFPPFIGTLAMFMFINVASSPLLKLLYLIFCYFFWDLLFSFEEVGIWGKLSLSSSHSEERAKITQWVSIGASLGGYIPKLFPTLWDLLEGNGMDEKMIFIMFAVIFGFGGQLIALNASKFKERVSVPVEKEESFFKSITVLRHNPTLLLIGAAKIIHEIYPRIDRTYFYQSEFRNNPHFKGGTAETLYDTLSSIPGALSVFFANKLIKKFGGMKRALLISQIAIIAARIIAYFIGIIPACKYNTLHGFIIMCVIIGVSSAFTSFMDIAHRSLINDSIDEVELKTGFRTEGITFSALSFSQKLNNSLQSLIKNITLYNFLGYKPLPGDPDYIFHQSPRFYKWQYPIFMLGPVIGEALYMIFIFFIKDDPERRIEVERQLIERREKMKEKKSVVSQA